MGKPKSRKRKGPKSTRGRNMGAPQKMECFGKRVRMSVRERRELQSEIEALEELGLPVSGRRRVRMNTWL